MGPTHRIVGAYAGAGYAWAAGLPLWQAAVSAGLATVTAAGATSPDMDQYGPWKTADGMLPDEILGNQGPMRHRGLTHWWGLAAATGVALWAVAPWWPLWALLAGWASHLAADFVFGRPGYGRGPGIPLAPWWGHVGLGLDTGGALEFLFRWALTLAPVAVLARLALQP